MMLDTLSPHHDIIVQILKYLLTIFVTILIIIYPYYYGVKNFLWLSDVGLFLTIIGLWTHSSLLISTAMVIVFLTELIWNIDFFGELVFKRNLIDLSDYMFDARYPMALRGISLFHVVMPLLWIWYLARFGYDTRAPYYATVLYWLDIGCVYFFTNPATNINWVFLPQVYKKLAISQRTWLILLIVGYPLLIIIPTHYICMALFNVAQ